MNPHYFFNLTNTLSSTSCKSYKWFMFDLKTDASLQDKHSQNKHVYSASGLELPWGIWSTTTSLRPIPIPSPPPSKPPIPSGSGTNYGLPRSCPFQGIQSIRLTHSISAASDKPTGPLVAKGIALNFNGGDTAPLTRLHLWPLQMTHHKTRPYGTTGAGTTGHRWRLTIVWL